MVPAPRPASLHLPGQDEPHHGTGHAFKHAPDISQLDIFTATKSGRLQDCKTIIQSEGPAVLSHFDAQGCTPAHWAALAGSCQLLQHFVDEGGLVDLPCRGELGQRPVHWAAVGGHTGAVELLGRAGVALDVGDRRGYTPLMVAAQYGHMELCCFLLGRGDGLQCRDCEGDSALHWAAFRGHCDLTRLLIYSGLDPREADSFGQTPLHLAVLSGDLLTVRLLCEQDAVALNSRDRDGNTPLQLCHGRRRRQVAAYLENTIEQSRRRIPKCDWSALVFGPPGKSKGSILFLYGCLLLWGYPTYFLKIAPVSFNTLRGVHSLFLLSNALMWFLFLKASLMDPGFLPRDSKEYGQALRQAVTCDEWRPGRDPLRRLCHTCHLLKPPRAKHCRVTDRCVEDFDHYCPYIYNSVGRRNRTFFLGFLASLSVSCWLGVLLCVDWFCVAGRSLLVGVGFVFTVVIGLVSGTMACTCLYLAALNVTTNERAAQERRGSPAPFDRGVLANLLEFFHLLSPGPGAERRTLDELRVV